MSEDTPTPSQSEIRSQAIAKLKRAASLPRRQPATGDNALTSSTPPSRSASRSPHAVGQAEAPDGGASWESRQEYEETLTPQREMHAFAGQYASPYTPHDLTAYGNLNQLPRSGVPSSFRPTPVPSPSPSPIPIGPLPGRSTPSPLPSLGELRQLHRANSAAGRLVAMKKLMGEEPPSPTALSRAGSLGSTAMLATHSSPGSTRQDVPRFGISSPSRRRRADRPSSKATDDSDPSTLMLQADETRVKARPQLERSYTVGNGGGEERRSVIGRRMMQRLGNRVAIGSRTDAVESGNASSQREEEGHSKVIPVTRQSLAGRADDSEIGTTLLLPTQTADAPVTPLDSQRFHSVIQDDSPTDPGHHRHPERSETPIGSGPSYATLAPSNSVPGGPPSRTSAVSGDDAFEYESHLRRSLSEKERKAKLGQITPEKGTTTEQDNTESDAGEERLLSPRVNDGGQALPARPPDVRRNEQTYAYDSQEEDADLLPPLAPFATSPSSSPSSRHMQNRTSALSGSSVGSSTDAMARIPFIVPDANEGPMQSTSKQGSDLLTKHAGREGSMASFPAEVDGEHSSNGYGTPGTLGQSSSNGGSTPSEHKSPAGPPALGPPILGPPIPAAVTPPPTASGSAFREHFDNDDDDEEERTESLQQTALVMDPSNRGRSDSLASWDVVGPPAEQEVDPKYRKTEGVVGQLHRSLSRTFSRRKPKREVSPAFAGSVGTTRTSRASSSGSGDPANQSNGSSPYGTSSFQDSARKGSHHSGALSTVPPVVFEPGQGSPMPQADPSDPRFHSTKLFPAPGAFPPMLQQASDSVVPTLQAMQSSSPELMETKHPPTVSAYPDLSMRSHPEVSESLGKKSWLAEAFFAPTGNNFLYKKRPSVSEAIRRKNSETDQAHPGAPYPPVTTGGYFLAHDRRDSKSLSRANSLPEPTAANVTPSLPPTAPLLLHRRVSPAEHIKQSIASHGVAASKPSQTMSAASQRVIKRLETVLALAPEDPDRPDVLDDPPRRLVLCSPMLQVVNGHTVKDRFLFLFTDILVIAKPLSDDPKGPMLDSFFAVKSIVDLSSLTLSASTLDEKPSSDSSNRHPVVLQFIDMFSQDPSAAIQLLYDRSQLQEDHATLASLLFKTPELDKEQLGEYLARRENLPLLRAFVDRFHFQGVRLDEALRIFLLSLRLPSSTVTCEAVLHALAERWLAANRSAVAFDTALAADLVLAIMQLNDALNPGSGFGSFAFPNPVISMDDFIGAFRTKDTQKLVRTDLLEAIYLSIKRESISQAVPRSQSHTLRNVIMTPARLPTRLTHNEWSENIFISIPKPDPRFTVKLHGESLIFDPPILDFSSSTEESFRVMGTSLGPHSMLMSRTGPNAPLYANLANAKTFVVERSFMKHTFQVAFVNHLGVKRKYCFSLEDAESRDTWCTALSTHIERTQEENAPLRGSDLMPASLRVAARSIALKVLQDSLIAVAEDHEEHSGKVGAPIFPGSGAAPTSFSPTSSLKKPKIVRQMTGRRVSVAKIMQESHGNMLGTGSDLPPVDEAELPEMPANAQKGKDIVLICRQNSILDIVLGLLRHAGGGDQNLMDDRERLLL